MLASLYQSVKKPPMQFPDIWHCITKLLQSRLMEISLTIAIAAIEHPNLMQALEEITGYKIDALIFPESEIRSLLDTSYQIPSDRGVELLSFSDNVFAIVDSARKIKPLAPAQLKNEKDIGEWLRSMIAEAIREKSREILIKPEAEGASIAYRKDTFIPSGVVIPSDIA